MKNRTKGILLSLAVAAVMTGCGSDGADTSAGSSVSVLSPADYATRSSASYDENTHGLISAEYAAKLITNWEQNKPEGKRKLFVMQFGNIYGFEGTHTEQISATETAEMGNGYIKSDAAAGVYVFDRTSGCTSTGDARSDGVSSVPKPVFDIEQMDQAFEMYGIDPDQDTIMLVLGGVSPNKPGEYMAGVARMWYTLTYWGYDQKSVMLLNGQASSVLDPDSNGAIAALGITREEIFTALPSTPPTNPEWKSISSVKRDGTVLQATMEEMMKLADSSATDHIIFDARSEAEYLGTKQAKTEYSVCGAAHDAQCYTAFDGHIKGASWLYFTDALTLDDGVSDLNGDTTIDYQDASFTFKPLNEVEAIFEAAGYSEGQTVYTYCRTGTKASLLTFTSAAVLGYPTRMYDGSWIQWGKMANRTDTYGDELLPSDSKWRTDLFSESVVYNPDALSVSPLNRELLNLDADHTSQIIDEDKASK